MTESKSLAVIPLAVGTIAALSLAKFLLSSKANNDFDSVVAQSSRLIAGSRAMEAEETDPIVNDPLAAALAGKKAVDASRRRQTPAPKGSGRKYTVNKMAIRTKWFDDQLLASLDMALGSLSTLDDYITSTLPADGIAPRQVVVLGSGMDTRPWRLRLPADLVWYEVDLPQVLATKINILQAAGAEVEPSSPMHRVLSGNTELEFKIGSIDHHSIGGASHPLRAESWEGVPADMSTSGGEWLTALKERGFDPHRKTIWVLEGLLMYFTPERAAEVLKEVAGASAPGSTLIANNVMDTVISSPSGGGKAKKNSLMAEWKFGWPADVAGFLSTTGWTLKLGTNRAKIANALRIPPAWCSFPTDPSMANDRASLFTVATI